MTNEIILGISGIVLVIFSFTTFFSSLAEMIANKSSRNYGWQLLGMWAGSIMIYLSIMFTFTS